MRTQRQNEKRFFGKGAMVSMGIYAISIFVYVAILPLVKESPARFLAVLIPVAPMLTGLYFYLKFMGAMDEMERRVASQSWVTGALIVGAFTFTYGFLEQVGVPKLPTFFYFPATIMVFGVVQIFVNRDLQ